MPESYARAVIWIAFIVGLLAAAWYFSTPISNGLEAWHKGFGVFGYILVFLSVMAIIGIIAYALKS